MLRVVIVVIFVACAPEASTSPCFNGLQDDTELGVDCGGTCTTCPAPTCGNGVLDHGEGETGVDCGGTCTPCPVVATTCDNGLVDGDEVGVDCGGSCAPCPVPATCENSVRDPDEPDVDCGGSCRSCATTRLCFVDGDCLSRTCIFGICRDPACDDGRHNGDETAPDCGGPCAPCAVEPTPSCDDGIHNTDESDVDCGGGCRECGVGRSCGDDVDCSTDLCVSGRCAEASCSDGLRNQDESDVDCGGHVCRGCTIGGVCDGADDCASGLCPDGSCAGETCDDGVRNGGETDVDCGGECTPCALDQMCSDDDDCGPLTVCRDRVCGRGSVVQMVAGDQFTCALLAERGVVACWGANNDGQLGVGDFVARDRPTVVPGLVGVTHLSAGDQHVCAIASGVVQCWGSNYDGQLADDTTSPRATPTVIAVTGATELTAGAHHTCALANGRVACWGRNSEGQLGSGDVAATPGVVTGVTATAVAAGATHTCAMMNTLAHCWGYNRDGQVLPTSTAAVVHAATSYYGLPVARVFAGAESSCVVTLSNKIECWGWGNTSTYRPVHDGAPIATARGWNGQGAAFGDDGVMSWGNHFSSWSPTPAIVLAMGRDHTCIGDGQAMWCEGYNGQGQLGIGTTGNTHVPSSGVHGLSPE